MADGISTLCGVIKAAHGCCKVFGAPDSSNHPCAAAAPVAQLLFRFMQAMLGSAHNKRLLQGSQTQRQQPQMPSALANLYPHLRPMIRDTQQSHQLPPPVNASQHQASPTPCRLTVLTVLMDPCRHRDLSVQAYAYQPPMERSHSISHLSHLQKGWIAWLYS